MLTPMQKDVLVELFNIHIGASASLLSSMANQKIILSIPEIELITDREFCMFSFEQIGIFERGEAVFTSIKFGNDFEGSAYMVFPFDKARALANACLGLPVQDVTNEFDLTLDESDILKEICNVALNSIIGQFGNLLEDRIDFVTPEVEFSLISSIEPKSICKNNTHILMLLTSFFFEASQIRGLILISLNKTTVKNIISKIDKLLEDEDARTII